ncbi:MAG: tetratricopeptide repeat protein [Flavisolibacter sp.]|nr:tetratricopeptide repeat protein [Flavisolibacter sp.]
MKQFFQIIFLVLLHYILPAQNNPYWQEPSRIQVDSLKKVLTSSANDTVKMYVNRQIGMYYQEINRMTALGYFEEMLKLARKTKQKVWEAEALSRNGYVSCLIQNYSGGLKFLLLAKNLASKKSLEKEMSNPGLLSRKNSAFDARMTILSDITNHLGLVHYFSGEYSKALEYHRNVKKINEILNDDALTSLSFLNMGEAYFRLGQLDSAETAFNNSIYYSDKSGYKKYKGLTLYDIGKLYEMRNDDEEAKKYYRLSVKTNIETESPDFEGMAYQALADISENNGDIDSVFYFSRQALKIYQTINDTLGLIAAYSSLSSAFDAANQTDSAYYNLKKAIILKDGLNKEGRIRNFQLAGFNEQMKLEEQKAEQLRTITRIRTYSFIAGITVLLFMTGIFYRNYRRQRKDKNTIEQALSNLRATQSQLIQSEKMASLGELTAGIAHEIQNPLNFVNNFSEVNLELIEEVKSEKLKVKSKKEEDGELEILNDIEENTRKIAHHGKRADAIVKSMLQHSRKTSGEKEPTDINALVDEYLRLSYHGFRAKDKSFNAVVETHFDPVVGKINIVGQDIGRVLLNLFNNAFYAVSEKKKNQDESYEPLIQVTTQLIPPSGGGGAVISVKDNGTGIPEKVLDKIFQPFFTTKPTGKGTGLGLSLSYDIITKGHGGEMRVETRDGEGSEFIIVLK